jgi:hypothetical protein
VRHNNQYSFDSDPLFFLSDDTWPVVRESSQPDCSITSLSAATSVERRFDTMTIAERISTDSTSTAPSAMALLVRKYGYGVSEVAKYLRRDQANVSTMLSRLSARQTERT